MSINNQVGQLMVSKPKLGKTTFARCLALSVAAGRDFLTWKTKRGR